MRSIVLFGEEYILLKNREQSNVPDALMFFFLHYNLSNYDKN
jgi:hypothetical protein